MDGEKKMREEEEGRRKRTKNRWTEQKDIGKRWKERETKGVMEIGKSRRKDRWKQERDEGWKDRENYKQEKERDGQLEGWMGRKEKWMGGGRERRMDVRTDRSKEEETRRTGKTEGGRDQGWKEGWTRK